MVAQIVHMEILFFQIGEITNIDRNAQILIGKAIILNKATKNTQFNFIITCLITMPFSIQHDMS